MVRFVQIGMESRTGELHFNRLPRKRHGGSGLVRLDRDFQAIQTPQQPDAYEDYANANDEQQSGRKPLLCAQNLKIGQHKGHCAAQPQQKKHWVLHSHLHTQAEKKEMPGKKVHFLASEKLQIAVR